MLWCTAGFCFIATAGDVMDNLDRPAQTFLVASRLAARGELSSRLNGTLLADHHQRNSQQASPCSMHSFQPSLSFLAPPASPTQQPSSSTCSSPRQTLNRTSSIASHHSATAAAAAASPTCNASSWHSAMGLLPGLPMVSLLHAAACGCEGSVLEAALPHVLPLVDQVRGTAV